MADIIDFRDLSREADEETPLEEEVFQCECGSVNWLICKDETMECSECGAFMGILDFLHHAGMTRH